MKFNFFFCNPFYKRSVKSYLREHKNILLGIIFLNLVYLFLSLSSPILTKIIIDFVIIKKNLQLLSNIVILMVIILIFGSILDIIISYIFVKMQQKVELNIRYDFYKHLLLYLPIRYYDSKKSGELFNRWNNDIDAVQKGLTFIPFTFIVNLIITIIIMSIMIMFNIQLSLIVFTIFTGHIVTITRFSQPIIKYSKIVREKFEKISGRIIENLASIKLIRSNSIVKKELLNFHQEFHDLIIKRIKSSLITKYSSNIINFLNNFWSFLVLYYGSYLVINEELSIGSLVAFIMLSGRLYQPIATLTNLYLNLQNISVSYNRFFEIFDNKRIINNNSHFSNDITGKIVFQNISFFYNSNNMVLKNVTFDILPNKITTIVGKSGVGKSTICNLLSRFYEPNDGQIFLDNSNINLFSEKFLHNNIRIVHQSSLLLAGTIKENITFGSINYTDNEIVEAAKLAYAHDFIKSFPDGYNTNVGEKGMLLSGGQAQRIAITRVILQNPKIIIFDEPASAIDKLTEKYIINTLKLLAKKKTILVISHSSNFARYSDIVVFIDNGRIIDTGKHNELLRNNDLYKKLDYQ